jgi:two-component system LytT family sensor kinase
MNIFTYNKKSFYLLIPLVALVIAGIFYLDAEYRILTDRWKFLVHSLLMTGGLWLGCMLIVTWLWKKYPWESFPVKHLVIEIILILLYTNLFSGIFYWTETKFGMFPRIPNLFSGILFTNMITLLITSLHEAVQFYKQWKYNFSRSVRLEKDTLEARYEALKTQVNPHFLFNSLNSLTTLVEDNRNAVDYIKNLSEFLRYMLKSRDRELVLVRDELSMLDKYLALQKLRFQESLQINVDIGERYYHYSTPPLVLQMLAENCLKHNIISKQKPLTINIKAQNGYISVENNLQQKNEGESTGQGLRNISERYRFFTVEQVKISQSNTTFKVSVPLLLVEL